MNDTDKTKEQLISESAELRRKLAACEQEAAELDRTREALRESEKKFRLISESINEVFWMADASINRMIYISPGYEVIWGRSRQSLYENPRSFLEAIHPEDRERVIAELAVQQRGEPFDHEYRIVPATGGVRWIWDRGFPVRDETGKISVYVGVASDITRYRQAEEALNESEERFRLFLEYCPVHVFFKDENVRAIQLSRNFEQLLGRPLDELLGKTMGELFPSNLARSMDEDDRRVLQGGKPMEIEEEFNGRTYSTLKFPILHQAKPRFLAGFTVDITERKRMEQQLRDSVASYRILFEASNDAIFIVDPAGTFIDANQTAYERLGYTREEFLAIPLAELDPPAFSARVPERMKEIETNGYAIFESAHLKKDGSPMPVEVSTRLIEYRGKKAFLSVVRDITGRKDAEAKIKLLSGFLPICSSCKKIRDDRGNWHQLESYIRDHSEAEFSHGICPDCTAKLYPGLLKK